MLAVVFLKNINNGPEIQTIKVSGTKQINVNKEITETVDYNFDVKPILSDKCYTCHGPDDKARQAGLRLDFVNGISDFLNNDTNHSIINLNNPQSSEII